MSLKQTLLLALKEIKEKKQISGQELILLQQQLSDLQMKKYVKPCVRCTIIDTEFGLLSGSKPRTNNEDLVVVPPETWGAKGYDTSGNVGSIFEDEE